MSYNPQDWSKVAALVLGEGKRVSDTHNALEREALESTVKSVTVALEAFNARKHSAQDNSAYGNAMGLLVPVMKSVHATITVQPVPGFTTPKKAI